MPRGAEEKLLTERLSKRYPLGQSELAREIERKVCGCDYGATSWATRQEADEVAGLLQLAPGRRLLDIGAGTGWPALFWARKTGCHTILTDVPVTALRIALDRAAADRPRGMCWAVAAEGAHLPFRSGSFDALSHSDVLCCLEAKLATLRECRRVILPGGRMAFTVIFPAAGLESADLELAIRSGLPFVATEIDYPTMLRMSGWTITERRDLTPDFARAVRQLLQEEEARAEELGRLYGPADFTDTLVRRRLTAEIAGKGHLRRELFAATTR